MFVAVPHNRKVAPHTACLSHSYVLRRKGMRTETSIIVETAQCFSTHHVALLVGYGAHAICPYLAFETCRQWRRSSRLVAALSPLHVFLCYCT